MIKDNVKLIIIRTAYWFGAIMDLLVAVSMTLYIFFDINMGLNLPANTIDNKTLLIWGFGLMWGWTFLLIWGNTKPIERRAIIILTLIPVVLLYIIGDICIVVETGYISNLSVFIRDTILRGILIIYCSVGYCLANRLAHPKFKN